MCKATVETQMSPRQDIWLSNPLSLLPHYSKKMLVRNTKDLAGDKVVSIIIATFHQQCLCFLRGQEAICPSDVCSWQTTRWCAENWGFRRKRNSTSPICFPRICSQALTSHICSALTAERSCLYSFFFFKLKASKWIKGFILKYPEQ